MAPAGEKGFLAWRVLNQNTGAEVVQNLAHLHQSSFTVRALQKGYPGSVSLGNFRILLPPPGTDLHKRNRYLYDLLVEGQKVEGYLGDVIAGKPIYSGVITKITKNLKDPWVIEGNDTLWWLQSSQTYIGEQLPQARGDQIVSAYSGTQEIVWSDNFATGFSLGYTNSGFFSTTTSDPYLQAPAATVSSNAPQVLTDTTAWARGAQVTNCAIGIRGTVACGTANTNAGNFGILLLSDGTGANGVLVNCEIDSTAGAAPYSAHLRIYSIAAGVLTLQAQQTNVLTGLGATLQYELQAIVNTQPWNSQTVLRAVLNGKDPGCVWTGLAGAAASGRIGVRYNPSAGGVSTLYVNNIQFEDRTGTTTGPVTGATNRFAAGSISTSPANNVLQPVSLSGQTYLDVIQLAAMVDGFFIRKNPGAGFKADSLDYAASPGTDLSSAVVFEEGRNVVDASVGPVPDLYATNARFNAVRGSDSGGTITWPRIGSIGDIVLTDTVQDVGAPGFRWMMLYALQVQARKFSPNSAQQIEVQRTPDVADKFRELDFVTVNVPTLGINQQKSLVLGYTFTEGSTTQTVYLSQFSLTGLPAAAHWFTLGAIEWLTSIYQPR